MDNFTDNWKCFVDCSGGCIGYIYYTIVAIEIDNFKYFGFEVAKLGHDYIYNILGGDNLLFPCGYIIFTITSPDLKRGLNMGNLGTPQTLEFLPVSSICIRHIAK